MFKALKFLSPLLNKACHVNKQVMEASHTAPKGIWHSAKAKGSKIGRKSL